MDIELKDKSVFSAIKVILCSNAVMFLGRYFIHGEGIIIIP